MILILGFCGLTYASQSERPANQPFTLVDEQNKVIHQTGTQVYTGDIYITADNSRYRVVEIISPNTARCVYQGKEIMPVISEQNASLLSNDIPVAAKKKPTIAVYHTHSDESYVPSDGKESINGNGGIYDVGQALVTELKKRGFKVQYNKNNHNPHDINAYNRSRKTAASLMKTAPDVILDVHRDAVPASQYQAKVKGEEVTKVKLVVGRSNPNMKTNLEFAKKIKAVMDKRDPGLSNGIYIGKGDYNQDLSPRAMLIEVGAHTNTKKDAENGVQLFADILPAVLGVSSNTASSSGQPAAKPLTQNNQGAWTTILIILVVVGAAAIGYYFLNRGSTNK
jgi:stage II sporulation protein P